MINRRRFTQLAAAAGPLCWAAPAAAKGRSPSPKRGCCYVVREDNDWRRNVELLNPAWMYSWGRKPPKDLPDGVDFTPMLWGDTNPERQEKRIADLTALASAGRDQPPARVQRARPARAGEHDRSERAVELWPDLMSVGVPLVSPGCVHPDKVWMKEFMEQVEREGLRVDAIAVHSYMGPSVEILVRRLEAVHKLFGRPLWITEFAVGDWKAKTRAENATPPKTIAAFMRELLPALDALPFVHRYAWFSASPSSGPLGTSSPGERRRAAHPTREDLCVALGIVESHAAEAARRRAARRLLLDRRLLFVALGLALVAARASATPPNLVVILTDDQGYADVGFNGCEDIPTPNIDRIASEGVRCTSGYVTHSVCGPSRAALVTGRYQCRFGASRNPTVDPAVPNNGVPLTERNLAELLAPLEATAAWRWASGTSARTPTCGRGSAASTSSSVSCREATTTSPIG